MMGCMQVRLSKTIAWLTGALWSATSWAQQGDEKPVDPRLEGYAKQVALPEPGSTALTWMLLIFLTLIAVAVLFKNAKRTHLD